MNDHAAVALDSEGYLINPEDWDESLASTLARQLAIALGEEHWKVLQFMRAYWQEHRVIPDVRHVIDHLAQALGTTKREAKQQLFKMFPYGYVQQACKIAGMQRPRAWSTG